MSELKVTKHNQLVETSYKLGSREQFFVLFLIANLSSRDQEFPQYRLPFSRIMKLMNFDGRRRIANVKDLEKMMDNLNTAPIKFVDGDEDVKVAWITELRYNRKTKEVGFTLNPNLKKYLLNLKGFFTNYNIQNIVYLSSHSIRMYELLKRHEYHKEQGIVFKVDYLKTHLGIEDKYPEFYEFKRWVLQTAQEELETYTDIRFLYSEYEKEGKKVLSLKFEIFENQPQQRPDELQLLERLRLQDFDRPYLLAPAEEMPTENDSRFSANSGDPLDALTWSKRESYDFLLEKGVNSGIILQKIFAHPKLKYPELVGFEDIYFRTLWHFLKEKSTAQNLAGAFVSWWKNEKFTTDQQQARFMELVIKVKKKMSGEELEMRKAGFSPQAPLQVPPLRPLKGEPRVADSTPPPFGARGAEQRRPAKFNFEAFKDKYPEVFAEIIERVGEEYAGFYKEMGVHFDASAMQHNLEAKARVYCEEWLKNRNNFL